VLYTLPGLLINARILENARAALKSVPVPVEEVGVEMSRPCEDSSDPDSIRILDEAAGAGVTLPPLAPIKPRRTWSWRPRMRAYPMRQVQEEHIFVEVSDV